MKTLKIHFVILVLLFAFSADISAQSFLNKISKGLEKVNSELDKLEKKVEPAKEEVKAEVKEEPKNETKAENPTTPVVVEENRVIKIEPEKPSTSVVSTDKETVKEPIYKTDLKERGLKGCVKAMTVTSEYNDSRFGNWGSQVVYSFSESGLLLKIDYTNKEKGKITSAGIVSCTHNNKGQLIKRTHEVKNGAPKTESSYGGKSETFTYNTAGRLIENYNTDTKTKTRYTYNAKGWKIREDYYVGTKKVNSKTISYDKNGNFIGDSDEGEYPDSYDYDSKNRLISISGEGGYSIEYKYNSNDDETEIIDAENGKTVSEYEYDSHKNWIKCISKNDDKNSKSLTKRVIEYY